MRTSHILALCALAGLLALPGCAGDEDSATGDEASAWRGTITIEGDVTTVVNESGSVWHGEAELVEEASIGVEAGADEYMFGWVASVWATEDRILVVDSQVPAVRAYDLAGNHRLDVGRPGEGPGEFANAPLGVVVDDAGDIVVVEESTQLEVFAPDGTPKATWNTGANFRLFANDMLILGTDGSLWVAALDWETRRLGYSMIGPDGNAGDPVFSPELEWERGCLTYLRRGREDDYCNIPYYPRSISARAPDGGWAIGTSDTYAFEVHGADGSSTRVERYWDPVPVSAEEAARRKQETVEYIRERADNEAWSWNGPEVPDHKPAYVQLIPDRDDRIWVLREQASRRSTDCNADVPECWIPGGYWLDAFAPDGRFLGSVTLDRRPAFRPFIDDDTVVATVIDDAGTAMVKRYRLVLSGEP